MKKKYHWEVLAAIILMAYLIISGNQGLWELYHLHQQKNYLQIQNVKLKQDIHRDQEEYKHGEDLFMIEKQAREELDLAKPGEIIYRFIPSSKNNE